MTHEEFMARVEDIFGKIGTVFDRLLDEAEDPEQLALLVDIRDMDCGVLPETRAKMRDACGAVEFEAWPMIPVIFVRQGHSVRVRYVEHLGRSLGITSRGGDA